MTTYKELYKTVKDMYELDSLTVEEEYLNDGIIEFNDSDDDQVLLVNCKNGNIVNGQYYLVISSVLSVIVDFNDTEELDRELDNFKEFISNGYKDLTVGEKYLPEIKLNENQQGFLNSVVAERKSFDSYLDSYGRSVSGFHNDYDPYNVDFSGEDKNQYEFESSRYYGKLNSLEILDVMKKLVAMEDEWLNKD